MESSQPSSAHTLYAAASSTRSSSSSALHSERGRRGGISFLASIDCTPDGAGVSAAAVLPAAGDGRRCDSTQRSRGCSAGDASIASARPAPAPAPAPAPGSGSGSGPRVQLWI